MSAFVVEDQERQREMNKNDRWEVPKTTLGGVQSVWPVQMSAWKCTAMKAEPQGAQLTPLTEPQSTALADRACGSLSHDPRVFCACLPRKVQGQRLLQCVWNWSSPGQQSAFVALQIETVQTKTTLCTIPYSTVPLKIASVK